LPEKQKKAIANQSDGEDDEESSFEEEQVDGVEATGFTDENQVIIFAVNSENGFSCNVNPGI